MRVRGWNLGARDNALSPGQPKNWRECVWTGAKVRDAMKTLIKPADRVSVVALWRGAEAKLWLFHVTHNRMAIQLCRDDQEDVLYMVAIGCERISGPLCWEPADIVLRSGPPDQWGEVRQHLVDSEAGFELVCSDVTIVRMPPAVPDNPFNGTFVDDPPSTAGMRDPARGG